MPQTPSKIIIALLGAAVVAYAPVGAITAAHAQTKDIEKPLEDCVLDKPTQTILSCDEEKESGSADTHRKLISQNTAEGHTDENSDQSSGASGFF